MTAPVGKISAIIRTRDSEKTLGKCLASLKAQSRPPDEIIVVDSGSSDGTLDIAGEHGCRVVHYPAGVEFNYSKALNIGIAASTGNFLLPISSHNQLIEPDIVGLFLDALGRESRCGVYCRHIFLPEPDIMNPIAEPPVWLTINRDNFAGENGLSNSCCLIPREAWQAHPFDENIPTCEDQEFALWHYHHTGLFSAKLANRRVLCLNERANDRKSIRDRVFIATHFYAPWRSPVQIIRHFGRGVISFASGDRTKAITLINLAAALTKSWFVKPQYRSRYY
jgi:glycosyltransferase involved in cell wall biosynthesis